MHLLRKMPSKTVPCLQQLEERLVRSFMSSWQRRGSSFLQVGLHSHIAPEFFWDAGFDVCASDEDINVLNYALHRSGPRVEYQLAKVDALPFDDDSFDYAFFTCYASSQYKIMKRIAKDLNIIQSRLAQRKTRATQDKNEHIDEHTNNMQSVATHINFHASNRKKTNLERIKNFALRGIKPIQEQLRARATRLSKSLRKNMGSQTNNNTSTHAGKKSIPLDAVPTFLQDASFSTLFSPSSILSETCRVAQKGVIILYKNKFSPRDLPAFGNKINPYSVWARVKQLFPDAEIKMTSSFMLPSFLQKKLNIVDVHSKILPVGELLGICIHFNPSVVTGLGVLSKSSQKQKLAEEPIVNRSNVRSK